MDIKEYIALLEVHPTACNQKEIERLTVVESPDQVHARRLRIAADMVEGGEYKTVMEICEQVMEEIKNNLPHWE